MHKINFTNPEVGNFGRNIYYAAELVRNGLSSMVEKGIHKDSPGCVIASTGPSIENSRVLARIRVLVERRNWTLIALKESVAYLADMGLPVSYAVSMDPGGPRQITRTPVRPGVTYCVASSCHPEFVDYLLHGGAKVQTFHSACGYSEPAVEAGVVVPLGVGPDMASAYAVMPGLFEMKTNEGAPVTPIVSVHIGETEIYDRIFPTRDVMEGGFAVVNRAIALADYMGFPKIAVAGADFGWRNPDAKTHYASFVEVGPMADEYMTDNGRVDGNEKSPWYTRPDQLASAADVARKALTGKVQIIGDSLAAAMARRGRAFVESVVRIEA